MTPAQTILWKRDSVNLCISHMGNFTKSRSGLDGFHFLEICDMLSCLSAFIHISFLIFNFDLPAFLSPKTDLFCPVQIMNSVHDLTQ